MKLFAEKALTPEGWKKDVCVEIDASGRITRVDSEVKMEADCQKREGRMMVPAMPNLHSHSFQRAISGLTEKRNAKKDNFWSWRERMYRFLEQLTPEDMEVIAAQVFMEMLECGYASVAEFHYVHHQANGNPYDNIAETSCSIISAANTTGIGLTHLPVLYMQAGLKGEPLSTSQKRFGNQISAFQRLMENASDALKNVPDDFSLGMAPHSLRAVSREALQESAVIFNSAPIHIHIAEQVAEVEQVQSHYGARPVEWLMENVDLNPFWCLIHATHMTEKETRNLAESGATAGVCPITEANLGDGIFNGKKYVEYGGRWGIGSDSNVRISLTEELRLLEYSQRFQQKERNVMTSQNGSVGQELYLGALEGGAQALNRKTGKIAEGYFADLVTLEAESLHLFDCSNDEVLDRLIFSGDDRLVCEVWSAGRQMVANGRHIRHSEIENRYRDVMRKLQ